MRKDNQSPRSQELRAMPTAAAFFGLHNGYLEREWLKASPSTPCSKRLRKVLIREQLTYLFTIRHINESGLFRPKPKQTAAPHHARDCGKCARPDSIPATFSNRIIT